MNAIRRGSADDCFKHFLTADFGERKLGVFADFMAAKRSTLSDWIEQRSMPSGENLLRLWYYLEFIGYNVVEIDSLQRPVQACGRLLAFRVVRFEDLMQVLSFQPSNERSKTFYVLLGKGSTSFERLEKMKHFAARYEESLSEAKKTTERPDYRGTTAIMKTPASEMTKTVALGRAAKRSGHSAIQTTPSFAGDQVLYVHETASRVIGLLPTLTYFVSSRCSDAEKQLLVELVSPDGFRKLSQVCAILFSKEVGK